MRPCIKFWSLDSAKSDAYPHQNNGCYKAIGAAFYGFEYFFIHTALV